ncbi:carbohydrate porin [Agarivorans aestuarii]|uniref:Carbohydrate porin n=1 Tax=Agarivorans aestuarii TaxID=1563703 RepID=A0ABU7G6Y1_9ALTE|nr:carbohydrate porin [Agarivorans aestuarii]MEE1675068.1 carbohydrate porin [Agarivorans aestuarii]
MKMKALTIAIAVASAATSLSSFAGTPNFSGYGRYALEASNDEIRTLKSDNAVVNGPGRLGNEGNWMEFMLSQGFENGDAKFDINVMMNTGGQSVGLAQFYGGGKGIFASQPDAYVWAGKRFYGREQAGLTDYFMLSADGSGAGVDNLDVGLGQLDLGWTQAGNGAGSETKGSANMLQLNWHDIMVSEKGALKFRFNYAFLAGDELEVNGSQVKIDDIKNDTAMEAFMSYRQGFDMGWVQLAGRYQTDSAALTLSNSAGHNFDNVRDVDAKSYGLFVDGAVNFGEMTAMEYNVSFIDASCTDGAQTCLYGTDEGFKDHQEYSAAIRPQHHWTEYMATALEMGLQTSKQDSVQSDAWKVTLSQNFQVGHFMWSRPVVRFYAVTGEVTTDNKPKYDLTKVGAMVEAWW